MDVGHLLISKDDAEQARQRISELRPVDRKRHQGNAKMVRWIVVAWLGIAIVGVAAAAAVPDSDAVYAAIALAEVVVTLAGFLAWSSRSNSGTR